MLEDPKRKRSSGPGEGGTVHKANHRVGQFANEMFAKDYGSTKKAHSFLLVEGRFTEKGHLKCAL